MSNTNTNSKPVKLTIATVKRTRGAVRTDIRAGYPIKL